MQQFWPCSTVYAGMVLAAGLRCLCWRSISWAHSIDRTIDRTAVMKAQFISNDPPFGTERVYNALGLAHALVKHNAANDDGRCACFCAAPAWMRAASKIVEGAPSTSSRTQPTLIALLSAGS